MALRIGRVAGVTIRIDVSVVVVFALVTWALATGTLPAVVDDAPAVARWVAAVCVVGLVGPADLAFAQQLATLGAPPPRHPVGAAR